MKAPRISVTCLCWFLLACGGSGTPTTTTPPPPASNAKVPLNDLGSQTYLGFSGGLYFNGANHVPSDHGSIGQTRASAVQPLDANGNPSAAGKIVLISLGMSNTTAEWCSPSASPPCTPESFMAKAAADSSVNHSTLLILDGAFGGQAASSWVSPTSANYDRVRDNVLAPNKVTEKQVEVVWVKQADPGPTVSLPASSADAFTLEKNLGDILRAIKVRWPNVQQAFFSSRIYGGYATTTLNPEPYAYESGFSVKWLVQAQIDQMRHGGAVTDQVAGDLSYTSAAPWIAWGPYLWANGTAPRSDGLMWVQSDFASDGTHPAASGVDKVSGMLMNFFLNSPFTPWFKAR